jgi:integrase
VSVYKSPNSPFYLYDFQVRGRRFHGSTKARNEKDAKVIEKQLKLKARADVELEEKSGQGPMTLDFAAGRYWSEIGEHHKDSAATYRNIQRLIEHFGKDKRLDEIGDAELAALIAWRRGQTIKGRKSTKDKPVAKIAPATVNRSVIEPLRKIMSRARKVWRVALPREPNWREHRLNEPDGRVRELHDHEEAAMTAAMRGDYAPWIDFTLLTGLRRAETLIRWENVNWQAKTITTVGKRGRLVSTPITEAVAAVLEPLKGHHPEFVFTYVAKRTIKGRKIVKGVRYPISYEGGKTEWQRLVKRAALKDFRYHDLRHTTATRLLRETGNMELVRKALNHADITTTARYAHVINEEVADALQRVAAKSRNKHRNADEDAT